MERSYGMRRATWGLSLPFAWTQKASQFAWGACAEGGGTAAADIQFVANRRRSNTRRTAACHRKSTKNKIELIETKSALLTKKKAREERGHDMSWAFRELRARTLLNSRKFALAPLPLCYLPQHTTAISAVHFHFHLQFQCNLVKCAATSWIQLSFSPYLPLSLSFSNLLFFCEKRKKRRLL